MKSLDHATFPNKGGAMEHWGMISYGEQYFAVNPETSAAVGKQTVGFIQAHEMAHLVQPLYCIKYIHEILDRLFKHMPITSCINQMAFQHIVHYKPVSSEIHILGSIFAIALTSKHTREPSHNQTKI